MILEIYVGPKYGLYIEETFDRFARDTLNADLVFKGNLHDIDRSHVRIFHSSPYGVTLQYREWLGLHYEQLASVESFGDRSGEVERIIKEAEKKHRTIESTAQ